MWRLIPVLAAIATFSILHPTHPLPASPYREDTVITHIEQVYFGRGTMVVVGIEDTPGNGGHAPRQRSIMLRLTPSAAAELEFRLRTYSD